MKLKIIPPFLMTFCLAFLLICLTPGNPAASDNIYFYIDEDGVYHYSNVPTSPRYAPSDINFRNDTPFLSEQDYDRLIRDAADTHGVEFALVKAVIRAESAFNPRAVSHAGAMGLMQIMPANLVSFKLSDPFDPEQNIAAGTRYLRHLLNRYGEDLIMALAAYNAGPAKVDYYQGIPPYAETEHYVERVLSFYDRYSGNQR